MRTEATVATAFEPANLLTPEELAERLKVSVTWVYEQTRTRTAARSEEAIPVVPVGRYLRFYWPDVCRWLRHRAQGRSGGSVRKDAHNCITESA